MNMTKKEEKAQRDDPRSVQFRAIVKGWAFTDGVRIMSMIQRATPYAWLPEHHETLDAMRQSVNGF
jgi:hypothetical protein